MRFLDFEKVFDRDELFYCGSQNLYKFLKYINKIHEINIKYIKKRNQDENNIKNKYIKCYIFVKCKKLQKCLDEWAENKKNDNLVYPSKNYD